MRAGCCSVTDKMVFRGRLNGAQRMRLGKLLDMLYKPSELAEEVGFSLRQVYRVYIPLGCPLINEPGHFWINGKAFAEWYEATYPKYSLLEDEAFCLSCRKPVKMNDPVKKKKGLLHYWICKCPACGHKLARITDKDKRKS